MSNSNVMCRLCAETRNSYMKLCDVDFDNKSLLHKVESIAPEIFDEDENMPKDICKNCYMQLNQAYKFKNKCLESQVKLKMSNICSKQKPNTNIVSHTTAINESKEADPICVFEENVNNYLIVELKHSDLPTEQEPNEEICLQENNNFETKVKSTSEIIQNIPEPSSILGSMLNKNQDNAKQKRKLKSHTCDNCNKIFNGRQSLYAHICIQKLIKQENRLLELQNQQISIKQEQNKEICLQENNEFESDADDKIIQNDSKPNSILESILNKNQNISLEQEKESNESILELNLCLEVNKTTDQKLLDPLKKEKFACDKCNTIFTSEVNLDFHDCALILNKKIISKTKIVPNSYVTVINSVDTPKEEITFKSYKCNHCNKLFRTKQNLSVHLRLLKGDKINMCEVCGKCFGLKSHLKRHILSHRETGYYVCEICGKQFKTPSEFQVHNNRHAGIKPYSCSYCDKKMTAWSDMKRHVRTHTNERPYSCKDCNKSYKTSHELTNHIRMHHTNDRPYHCTVCEKKFTISSNLKKHLRTHTLERPFKCETCDKAFRQKKHLRQHKVVHTGVKAYACDICDKRFTLKQNMQVHKRLHDKKPSTNLEKNTVEVVTIIDSDSTD